MNDDILRVLLDTIEEEPPTGNETRKYVQAEEPGSCPSGRSPLKIVDSIARVVAEWLELELVAVVLSNLRLLSNIIQPVVLQFVGKACRTIRPRASGSSRYLRRTVLLSETNSRLAIRKLHRHLSQGVASGNPAHHRVVPSRLTTSLELQKPVLRFLQAKNRKNKTSRAEGGAKKLQRGANAFPNIKK